MVVRHADRIGDVPRPVLTREREVLDARRREFHSLQSDDAVRLRERQFRRVCGVGVRRSHVERAIQSAEESFTLVPRLYRDRERRSRFDRRGREGVERVEPLAAVRE
ncbi:MAG: hypothetical protein ABEI99_10900 [Halobaculum sp.]